MNTGTYGAFTATYTLNLSDENLPGAQPTAPLTLTLTGQIAMAGDSNIDGVVNALDFNALASDFGQAGQNWGGGDFNGDGTVNTIDFTAMAQDFGNSYNPNPAPPAFSLTSLVPEPGAFAASLAYNRGCWFPAAEKRQHGRCKSGVQSVLNFRKTAI